MPLAVVRVVAMSGELRELAGGRVESPGRHVCA